MPQSAIETVLSKATKIKQGAKEDRQTFLIALGNGIQDLTDKQWDVLGEGDLGDECQKWANEATKAIKAKKTVKDFSDVGKVKPDADEDGDDDKPPRRGRGRDADGEADDDDDKPSRRGAAKEDDDDDKPARRGRRDAEEADDDDKPARRGRAAKEEEADDDDKPARRGRGAKDDDDDKPARRGRAAKEDDDKPARRGAASKEKEKSSGIKQSGTGVKNSIKLAILDDLKISVDDLVKKLGKGGASVSKVTVSNIRAEFRHTLKLLHDEKVNCAKLEI